MKFFGLHITRNSPVPFSRGDGYHLLDIIRQHITNTERQLMLTLQSIKDQLAKLAADAEAQKANVASLLDALRQQVAGLSAGQSISQEDLESLSTQITGIDTAVQAISTVTTTQATQAASTVDAATSGGQDTPQSAATPTAASDPVQ